MKDIKELIYAAVEENALKFQEIVNNQLQVRAYEAIESLRPEIGASMFGEAKECDDEDEEEMEDEEDEDEKSVKESAREYLNQKGTGKSAEGYDDAGTFDRQTAERHAAKHGGKVVPDPSGKHLVVLRGKKMQEAKLDPVGREDSDIDNDGDTDKSDKYLHNRRKAIGKAIKEMSDAERRTELKRVGNKAAQTQGYDHPGDEAVNKASSSAVKSELKAVRKFVAGTAKPYRSPANEEVEQIDEIGNTPAGRAALGKLAAARDGRADWARGVAKHGSVGSDAAKHNALADKDRAVAKTAAGKAGIDHRTSPSTNYDHDKHGGYGTDKPNPADKFAARNKPKMEEVEIDETTGAKLRKVVPGLGKFIANRRAEKARAQSRGGGPISDDPSKQSQDDKLRLGSQKQAKRYEKIANEDVNEVAMPKNAADWQALITHQIQTTGHPVATDAQFRAQNCKDTSKIASLEPGQDALQYATAQGGTVKLP
jgi:hypothetical protein